MDEDSWGCLSGEGRGYSFSPGGLNAETEIVGNEMKHKFPLGKGSSCQAAKQCYVDTLTWGEWLPTGTSGALA